MHIDTLQSRVERGFRMKRMKQFLAIFALVLVICSVFTMMTPNAHAACGGSNSCSDCKDSTWLSYRNQIESKINGFAASCWDVATTAGNCNPHFNFSTIAGTIYKFSTYDGKWLDGGGTSIIAAGKAMYESMSVVGICLIFLFFLIDLLDEVQADSFTIEHLIKKLLTLTVAIVVLDMGGEIFDYLCQLGDALINDASKAASAGNQVKLDTLFNQLIKVGEQSGLLSSILAALACVGILLENIVPYILMLVAVIIAYLVGFGRFIEVLVRFAFAPIGMAQLVSGGAKGPGMRYIKKFASVVLQGAVCTLAFGCVTILTNASSGLNAVLSMLLVPITLIGFLLKVGRIADDICGV